MNAKATYHYRIGDFTPVATATEVLTISGAPGKTVYVTKLSISGTATAAAIYDLYITKRTTANTGGTATNPTPTPSDTLQSPAGAVVTLYTANPTAGTGVALEGDKLFLPAAATPAAAPTHAVYEWGTRGDTPPVLRGTGESIGFNFAGAAVPAGTSLYMSIEWIEV